MLPVRAAQPELDKRRAFSYLVGGFPVGRPCKIHLRGSPFETDPCSVAQFFSWDLNLTNLLVSVEAMATFGAQTSLSEDRHGHVPHSIGFNLSGSTARM